MCPWIRCWKDLFSGALGGGEIHSFDCWSSSQSCRHRSYFTTGWTFTTGLLQPMEIRKNVCSFATSYNSHWHKFVEVSILWCFVYGFSDQQLSRLNGRAHGEAVDICRAFVNLWGPRTSVCSFAKSFSTHLIKCCRAWMNVPSRTNDSSAEEWIVHAAGEWISGLLCLPIRLHVSKSVHAKRVAGHDILPNCQWMAEAHSKAVDVLPRKQWETRYDLSHHVRGECLLLCYELL